MKHGQLRHHTIVYHLIMHRIVLRLILRRYLLLIVIWMYRYRPCEWILMSEMLFIFYLRAHSLCLMHDTSMQFSLLFWIDQLILNLLIHKHRLWILRLLLTHRNFETFSQCILVTFQRLLRFCMVYINLTLINRLSKGRLYLLNLRILIIISCWS